MTFRFNPTLAVLLAAGACGISQAAILPSDFASGIPPEAHVESRTVIVDGNSVRIDREGSADIVLAQGPADGQKREVRIVTHGSGPVPADSQDFKVKLPDLPDIDMIVSSAMSEAFSGAGIMTTAKNVKNAPYSAEVISEKTQTLPDGNQITQKSSSLSYRDSAGRTRQETRNDRGEVRSVHIHDTVEGTRYMLSPAKKSASKISIDKDLHKRIEAIKEKARVMAKDGKAHIIERGNPGEEIVVKRLELPASDNKKEVREEVRVNVVRTKDGPAAAGSTGKSFAYRFGDGESFSHAFGESMQHGPIGMSFKDMKWSGKSTTTSLGVRDFEGVRADGKSVSYTIPAGEIGNKNPITVTTETWTSPDLHVVVYSKHSDPRVGDSVYRLANVKRGEPPATLFMVPDGYSLKETPGISLGSKTK